jgi:hypothetical protein
MRDAPYAKHIVVIIYNSPKINLFEADAAIDAAAGQMELLAEPRPLILRVYLKHKAQGKKY